MALNSTIALGGGAAHSGTATPGSYAMAECETCGAVADTLYKGWSPLCFRCEEHARESEEELRREREEEIGDCWCQDCGAEKATCLFLHLDGRRFYLCGLCFAAADHEPDYLMFCECRIPERQAGSDYCGQCVFKIRCDHEEEPPEDYEGEDGATFDYLDDEDDGDYYEPPAEVRYCGCPVPCREFKDDETCFFCHGTI